MQFLKDGDQTVVETAVFLSGNNNKKHLPDILNSLITKF